ncbi:OsmC family peroxiredoxin [Streptomyces rochei]|uniref:OsmC family peroxiredoxin n=1 Tax=Streptomyces rochei TaxID=1928 RepID=UPI0037CD9C85
MGRVVLDTSFSSHDAEELWASLTTQEARGLAGLPLYQAAAVDPRAPEAPGVVEVLPVAGEAYAIRIRGHELTVDQVADRPARVASLSLTVVAPQLPTERLAALRAVVSHCTVTNSMASPPEMELRVSSDGGV